MAPAKQDRHGAFVPGEPIACAPLGSGRLSGLRFAAKDVFAVAGRVTGYGNPDWQRTHDVAPAHAPLITTLLQAGAELAGVTKTVELAWGMTGINPWQGTPINPAAPDRLPGGSSCGSAAAVAGESVDFALGTDTGGSVRVPASYCGIFGIRPSFGAVSAAGVCPLAPSMDVPGWFARQAAVLAEVGEAVLALERLSVSGPLLRLEEAWVGAQAPVAEALRPAMARLEKLRGRTIGIRLLPEGVDAVYDHFRTVQAEEAWATLGPWVESTGPKLAPDVAARVAAARALDPEAAAAGRAFRRTLRARIRPLLAGGAILLAPTSPCPAPLTVAGDEELEAVRQATIGITAVASLCGLCEVTLPAGKVAGAPVGLSLIAGPGRDRGLLAFACDAADVLGLPV
ncbi:MAG TPA: amidase [Acetobacteraceae bacterium]|nr:amidase [Acetobacteraceae bacterium]